jgi:FeS assembly SUF system protein
MTMDGSRKKALTAAIIEQLKKVYDPEIPVNIYDMGMIYEIRVADDAKVKIVMTLTSPNCPMIETLPEEVRESVMGVPGVADAGVELTFDPPWDQSMMTPGALLELGLD